MVQLALWSFWIMNAWSVELSWLLRLLCFCGLHKWLEPHEKDVIRRDGLDILFWTEGIQKGARKCERCGHLQKVYRTGMVGAGGTSNPWKPMSDAMEAKINRKPVL